MFAAVERYAAADVYDIAAAALTLLICRRCRAAAFRRLLRRADCRYAIHG